MGMADMLSGMREELQRYQDQLVGRIRGRADEIRDFPWLNSTEVAGPAKEEAKEAATYFFMGLSKKLMAAAPDLPAAMANTAVLTERSNVVMLDTLLLTAYLRGLAKALELTGQQLTNVTIPEAPAAQEQTPDAAEGSEQPCPHCGQVHGAEDEVPANLAEALQDLSDLGKLLERIGGGRTQLGAIPLGRPQG